MDRFDFTYVGEANMKAVRMPDGVFVKHEDHVAERLRVSELLRKRNEEIERLKKQSQDALEEIRNLKEQLENTYDGDFSVPKSHYEGK